jgi:hypothetical protein
VGSNPAAPTIVSSDRSYFSDRPDRSPVGNPANASRAILRASAKIKKRPSMAALFKVLRCAHDKDQERTTGSSTSLIDFEMQHR